MLDKNNTNKVEHLGLILDGNRRWAKENSKSTLSGHRFGSEVFKKICLDCFDKGIKYVTAFIFSTENWTRTEEEVSYLMNLISTAAEKFLDVFDQKSIKVVVIGQRDKLHKAVIKTIEQVEAKTKNNTKGTLVLCLNYGGQQEIVDTVKKLLEQGLKEDEINIESFSQNIYEPTIPPIDLIIRTSGEQRLSGFMLWRAAYSELKFVDKYWPDFTEQDLDDALADYSARQRRFGK